MRDRQRVRRATAHPEPDPSERAGELNIVPFLDIVVNLMLFLLATSAAVTAVAQHDVELPTTCAHCGEARSVDPSVTLTETGVVVASREGVACRIEGHDFAALGACLTELRAQHPDERTITLSAAPAIPYEQLIRAMDAAEGAGMPTVRLSAGVR